MAPALKREKKEISFYSLFNTGMYEIFIDEFANGVLVTSKIVISSDVWFSPVPYEPILRLTLVTSRLFPMRVCVFIV